MHVRRTIPQRARSLVGPWCFLDHFGSPAVEPAPGAPRSGPAASGPYVSNASPSEGAPAVDLAQSGMHIPPHPHIGLQTVSWLFEGEIEHRDSVGSVQTVRPGELNLMTSGRGISHSEMTPPARRPGPLRGVQMWTALPNSARSAMPFFEHHATLPVLTYPGARVHVILGGLDKIASPATVFSPLVCAQVDLDAGARLSLPINPLFEHGVLVDAGQVKVQGERVPEADLAYVATGPDLLDLVNIGPSPTRIMLIGGAPFGEDILMWWNFVGRTHEEIVEARADWQAGLTRRAAGADPSARFGRVDGYDGPALPAPTMPDVRLRARTRT